MKRNILAVVIPALLAAGAANAAEIYNKDGNKLNLNGKLDGLHYFSKDNTGRNSGDQSYVRLGFTGETKINSDLTGYGRFEYQFNANRTEETESKNSTAAGQTRYAYAGLKFADFGSLDYGRNRNVSYDGISYTDVLPEWGGDSAYNDGFTGRSAGVANYRNKNFFGLVDGLNFGLSYQSARSDSTTRKSNTGAGYALSTSYTSPYGVGIIGSYGHAKRTANTFSNATSPATSNDQAQDGRGTDAEMWATGLKYDANNIYVAATYGEYRNMTYGNTYKFNISGVSQHTTAAFDKTKVFEAVAQYNFDFGLKPSIGYVSAKAEDNTAAQKTSDYLVKYASLGLTYSFNKNFSTYTEYDINLLKDDNLYKQATNDRVAVGVVYQF
ncbi:porin [Dickeya sp. CFBP 2040]|uniref:Porin n=1 Tax=Dickeya poaceiphila TaxID=568768 RepID=A0A5B8IBL3_9GAMM|nr:MULTISPECIES: porin [Dickeya]NKI74537.1 porin [Dickeya sp. CFBP 2040]QDX29750.1 porin [Dickeya poaceiphila]